MLKKKKEDLSVLLFFSNAFKRGQVRFHVHELSVIGIPRAEALVLK